MNNCPEDTSAPLVFFDLLLDECIRRGASDLHLTAGQSPCYREQGALVMSDKPPVSAALLTALINDICNPFQREHFEAHLSVDVGYSSEAGERFRLNAYRQLGRPAIAIRHLDQHMLSIDELRLPRSIGALASLKSGLVLICGATGSGKSTTLAALIDLINTQRTSHIITIEDPVEFIHESQKSLIHHREIGTDVNGFADAVRAAMREDPDVILVGEMRDLETVRAALTAAETGHLVLSTLHTGEAVGSIERLVGSFPGEEQTVARHRIAMALRAVVAQHLIPTASGGRVPAVETLLINHAVANLIENNKSRQIYSVMETGSSSGMQTLDQALVQLVRNRLLSREDILPYCRDVEAVDKLLGVDPLQGSSGRSASGRSLIGERR